MGLLDVLAGIGGGIEGGTRAAEAIEKRKRDRAEEERRAKEFERENAERTAYNREAHGLYNAERADEGDETNDALTTAADAAMGAGATGTAALNLPFASTALRVVGAKAKKEGEKASEFDPNVPYADLVKLQGARRDARSRAGDRTIAAAARRDGIRLQEERLQDARTTAERGRGDTEAGRAMLLRLAQDPGSRIGYTPDEIKGLSPAAIDKLALQYGQGNLRTGDYRDRREITINMPIPKSGGSGGGGPNDNITLSDINAATSNQNRQIEQLLESAPEVVRNVFGGEIRGSASEIAAKIPKELRSGQASAAVNRWLANLQQAQQTVEAANRRGTELVTGGVRRGTGGDVPPLDRPPARPAAALPPAPRDVPPPAAGGNAKEEAYRAARRAGKTHEEAIRIAEGA